MERFVALTLICVNKSIKCSLHLDGFQTDHVVCLFSKVCLQNVRFQSINYSLFQNKL